MKNLVVIIALVLSTGMVYSQSSQRVTGPKAKNAKPWQKDRKSAQAVYTGDQVSINNLKGPRAKNAKPWKENRSMTTTTNQGDTKRITGPKAKNAKPWK